MTGVAAAVANALWHATGETGAGPADHAGQADVTGGDRGTPGRGVRPAQRGGLCLRLEWNRAVRDVFFRRSCYVRRA